MSFIFSGLEKGSWFEKYFQPYHLFGYIGDGERVKEYQQRKPIWRRVIERVAVRTNIISVIANISGIPTTHSGSGESAIAREIIAIIDEAHNRRAVVKFLQQVQSEAVLTGRNFTSIERHYDKISIINADQATLESNLVSIEARLTNYVTAGEFSPVLAEQLERLESKWILTDFPPSGLSSLNERFEGNVVLLKEDPMLDNEFSSYLPFHNSIGWYPFCKITGFYDTRTLQSINFPTISAAFIEYRRPKQFLGVRDDLFRFINEEVRRPIYISEGYNKVLASYLLPIIVLGSGLSKYRVEREHQKIIHGFVKSVGDMMPSKLKIWYTKALSSE